MGGLPLAVPLPLVIIRFARGACLPRAEKRRKTPRSGHGLKTRRRDPGFVVLTRRAPAALHERHFVAEWTVGGEYGMLCNMNNLYPLL